jgi:hypothetical protein
MGISFGGGGGGAGSEFASSDITGQTTVTAASGDLLIIADVSDSNNLKKVTAQTIADLAAASGDRPADFSPAAGSSSAVANTTTETGLDKTVVITGNTLRVGDKILVEYSGYYSTTGTPTFFIGSQIGGSNMSYQGYTASNNASNRFWHLSVELLVVAIGASGSLAPLKITSGIGGSALNNVSDVQVLTVDTTGNITIRATLDWDAASASNTAHSRICLGTVIGVAQ